MPPTRSNKYLCPAPGASRGTFFMLDDTVSLKKNVPMNGRNWTTKSDVYDRLFSHHTFSSIRRHYLLDILDMIPKDSLDFALLSIYVHSEDHNVPKSYIPMQPETLNNSMWNVGPAKMKIDGPKISTVTSSRIEHSEQGRKAKAPKIARGEVSTSAKYAMKTSNVRASRDMLTTKHGGTVCGKNFMVSTRDVKSTVMLMATAHNVAKGKIVHDILDKTRRRETYAAQMRAIERIHPSSLKLAVDGPHSDQTNPGYSRKLDGTLYSV